MAQMILMGMQRDIETQIDWRLQQQATTRRRTISNEEIGVILGSLGIAIPLTAIAAASSGFAGILVVWLGLVLVNLAWSQRR
jgi:sulfite exporter TauE/SafE